MQIVCMYCKKLGQWGLGIQIPVDNGSPIGSGRDKIPPLAPDQLQEEENFHPDPKKTRWVGEDFNTITDPRKQNTTETMSL